MCTKVFFAAVAQPDAQFLGNLIFLFFGKLVVQSKGFFPFASASAVIVGVPVAAGNANAATGFFDQGFAGEGEVGRVSH